MSFKLLAFVVLLATSASVNAAALQARGSNAQLCPWGSVLDDFSCKCKQTGGNWSYIDYTRGCGATWKDGWCETWCKATPSSTPSYKRKRADHPQPSGTRNDKRSAPPKPSGTSAAKRGLPKPSGTWTDKREEHLKSGVTRKDSRQENIKAIRTWMGKRDEDDDDDDDKSASSSQAVGAIVGEVIGGVALLFIAIAFIFWYRARKNKKRSSRRDEPMPPMSYDHGYNMDHVPVVPMSPDLSPSSATALTRGYSQYGSPPTALTRGYSHYSTTSRPLTRGYSQYTLPATPLTRGHSQYSPPQSPTDDFSSAGSCGGGMPLTILGPATTSALPGIDPSSAAVRDTDNVADLKRRQAEAVADHSDREPLQHQDSGIRATAGAMAELPPMYTAE